MTRMGFASVLLSAMGCQVADQPASVGAAPGALLAQSAPFELVIDEQGKAECGEDLPNATASLAMAHWWDDRVAYRIEVRKAVPNMLYTVWLKLASPSPITGAGATPFASTDSLDDLLEAGDGEDGHPAPRSNGFWTDADGNGRLTGLLDFDPNGESFPFDRFDEAWEPVPIGHAPFTVRLISHCTDLLGHGAYPGVHEPTFDLRLR